MVATYQQIKMAVLEAVDQVTQDAVVDNYKPKGRNLYDATTNLIGLYINEWALPFMIIPLNESMKEMIGREWRQLSARDVAGKKTIGDLITLACRRARVIVPLGEPK